MERPRPAPARPFAGLVVRGGNNTKPVRKALRRRDCAWERVTDDGMPGGTGARSPPSATAAAAGGGGGGGGGRARSSRGAQPLVAVPPGKEGLVWPANFVWKATWRRSRQAPPSFKRGHPQAHRRQIVNHLRGVEPLCTKDRLFRTMHHFFTATGRDPFRNVPPTFIIQPRDRGSADQWRGYPEFEASFREYAADPSCKNLWLIKPTSMNRGIGIEVMDSLDAIRDFLRSKGSKASIGIQSNWILQKYIEDPLLYHGRKFDLRMWVLVNDTGDVYVYAPGYVRTSSEVFSLDTTERFVHLTNYCQQVKNVTGTFGSYEDGNTASFDDLIEYLGRRDLNLLPDGCDRPCATRDPAILHKSGLPPVTAEQLRSIVERGRELMYGVGGMWDRMCDLVRDTFRALHFDRPSAGSFAGLSEYGFGLKPTPSSQHRFELLGYDFMVDSKLNLWFIEVNTNPSLSYQNGWHKLMVDRMMNRLFRRIVDPLFAADVRSGPPAPGSSLFHATGAGKGVSGKGASKAAGGSGGSSSSSSGGGVGRGSATSAAARSSGAADVLDRELAASAASVAAELGEGGTAGEGLEEDDPSLTAARRRARPTAHGKGVARSAATATAAESGSSSKEAEGAGAGAGAASAEEEDDGGESDDEGAETSDGEDSIFAEDDESMGVVVAGLSGRAGGAGATRTISTEDSGGLSAASSVAAGTAITTTAPSTAPATTTSAATTTTTTTTPSPPVVVTSTATTTSATTTTATTTTAMATAAATAEGSAVEDSTNAACVTIGPVRFLPDGSPDFPLLAAGSHSERRAELLHGWNLILNIFRAPTIPMPSSASAPIPVPPASSSGAASSGSSSSSASSSSSSSFSSTNGAVATSASGSGPVRTSFGASGSAALARSTSFASSAGSSSSSSSSSSSTSSSSSSSGTGSSSASSSSAGNRAGRGFAASGPFPSSGVPGAGVDPVTGLPSSSATGPFAARSREKVTVGRHIAAAREVLNPRKDRTGMMTLGAPTSTTATASATAVVAAGSAAASSSATAGAGAGAGAGATSASDASAVGAVGGAEGVPTALSGDGSVSPVRPVTPSGTRGRVPRLASSASAEALTASRTLLPIAILSPKLDPAAALANPPAPGLGAASAAALVDSLLASTFPGAGAAARPPTRGGSSSAADKSDKGTSSGPLPAHVHHTGAPLSAAPSSTASTSRVSASRKPVVAASRSASPSASGSSTSSSSSSSSSSTAPGSRVTPLGVASTRPAGSVGPLVPPVSPMHATSAAIPKGAGAAAAIASVLASKASAVAEGFPPSARHGASTAGATGSTGGVSGGVASSRASRSTIARSAAQQILRA